MPETIYDRIRQQIREAEEAEEIEHAPDPNEDIYARMRREVKEREARLSPGEDWLDRFDDTSDLYERFGLGVNEND